MDAELDRDPQESLRSAQLRLIDPAPPVWRLDDRTREVGRLGIAAARAALQSARSHVVDGEQDHHERSAA